MWHGFLNPTSKLLTKWSQHVLCVRRRQRWLDTIILYTSSALGSYFSGQHSINNVPVIVYTQYLMDNQIPFPSHIYLKLVIANRAFGMWEDISLDAWGAIDQVVSLISSEFSLLRAGFGFELIHSWNSIISFGDGKCLPDRSPVFFRRLRKSCRWFWSSHTGTASSAGAKSKNLRFQQISVLLLSYKCAITSKIVYKTGKIKEDNHV